MRIALPKGFAIIMRIDVFLSEREGITRSRASNLIKSGSVFINGKPETKSGTDVSGNEKIEVIDRLKYASLGGIKLDNAIRTFHLDLTGKRCLDIGAANGGFTDCMLKCGAESVVATDLHVEFPFALQNDARVSILDGVNVKDLPSHLNGRVFDFITVDLSFISLTALFPIFVSLLAENGELLCLFKPQFEVGKRDLPKSGVVRDQKAIERAFNEVLASSENAKLTLADECPIPALFDRKNQERTLLFVR